MRRIDQIEASAKQVLNELQGVVDELDHPELKDQAVKAAEDQDKAVVRVTAIRIAVDAIERAGLGRKSTDEE